MFLQGVKEQDFDKVPSLKHTLSLTSNNMLKNICVFLIGSYNSVMLGDGSDIYTFCSEY